MSASRHPTLAPSKLSIYWNPLLTVTYRVHKWIAVFQNRQTCTESGGLKLSNCPSQILFMNNKVECLKMLWTLNLTSRAVCTFNNWRSQVLLKGFMISNDICPETYQFRFSTLRVSAVWMELQSGLLKDSLVKTSHRF
jgi:hypothetical protein